MARSSASNKQAKLSQASNEAKSCCKKQTNDDHDHGVLLPRRRQDLHHRPVGALTNLVSNSCFVIVRRLCRSRWFLHPHHPLWFRGMFVDTRAQRSTQCVKVSSLYVSYLLLLLFFALCWYHSFTLTCRDRICSLRIACGKSIIIQRRRHTRQNQCTFKKQSPITSPKITTNKQW